MPPNSNSKFYAFQTQFNNATTLPTRIINNFSITNGKTIFKTIFVRSEQSICLKSGQGCEDLVTTSRTLVNSGFDSFR